MKKLKKKNFIFLIAILSCFVIAIVVYKMPNVFAAQVLSANATGTQDGYDYELWKDSGNTSMTLNSGGTFSCQWSNINNALFRKGKKLGSTKTYQQLGNISVKYGCTYNPSGNSYLCVYGWTTDPLVEYYIVDSWGTWRPPGASSKGTITVDGGTYDVYETTRVNQPSIQGNTTFKQYWSVRTSKRTSGTITVSDHFKAWEKFGMTMGKMYEVALTVEGYQSSGSANVYENTVTIGGSSASSTKSSSTAANTNTTAYASSGTNPDVSWINPSKKLVAFAFDDGPVSTSSSSSSMRILNALKTNNCHATFFYWGNKITSSTQGEITQAFNQGCEVANHTFTHPYLTNLSYSQIQSEISQTANKLTALTGQTSFLVRPPYLSTNSTVLSAVNSPLITCSLDSGDWNNGNYNSVVNAITSKVKDGDILLMHENYDFTAQAVEYLIPYLHKQGYEIVTVSELFKMKGKTPTAGNVYSSCTGTNVTTYYNNSGSSSASTPTTAPTSSSTSSDSTSKKECENMTLSGSYAGKISSPFSGVALYANNDTCSFNQYFSGSSHSFSLRACSNNSNMAKVDLKIGGQYKGTFYYGGSYPAVYTLNNISHGTGNQKVELVVTSDDGNWDAYVDYLEIK